MELELGLAPPTTHLELSCSSDSSSGSGKRAFQETLPLFFDDGSKKKKQQLVGWPPVSSALRSRASGAANNYVKVKKQGEAIGRKVDLSVLASYDDLVAALGRMFPATNDQSERNEISTSTSLVVTYEDGEGDWMLAGDLPWDDFVRSVKRLKILGYLTEDPRAFWMTWYTTGTRWFP